MDSAKAFGKRWPSLTRDTGADILKLIQQADDGLDIVKQIEFAKDSLFCEWAYVLDFDKNTFEAFIGFNKFPLASTERFFSMQKNQEDGCEYYPIRLGSLWQLDKLPTDKEFLAALEQEDE
jgi:hypothetical protein